MSRILITGANGFLGSRLAYLSLNCDDSNTVFGLYREKNHKTPKEAKPIVYLQCDINDLEGLKRIISDYEIEVVYHLAAQSIVRIANTNPLYCFQNNVIGTANVLESVRQINPKIKVVCASSDKAYGEHEELPYQEDFALKAGDPYSTSKACGDLVAQSYAKTYGLNVNIIRSANIYGPGDMNLSRIIPNTILRIKKGQKPQIYSGVMDFVREFIYVDDVCSAYQIAAHAGVYGQSFNVGTSHVFKVSDLIGKICVMMGWNEGIEVIDKSFHEITTQYLTSAKIELLYGWEPKTDINEGLKKTIAWYLAR